LVLEEARRQQYRPASSTYQTGLALLLFHTEPKQCCAGLPLISLSRDPSCKDRAFMVVLANTWYTSARRLFVTVRIVDSTHSDVLNNISDELTR
jgi:hypothetical protein